MHFHTWFAQCHPFGRMWYNTSGTGRTHGSVCGIHKLRLDEHWGIIDYWLRQILYRTAYIRCTQTCESSRDWTTGKWKKRKWKCLFYVPSRTSFLFDQFEYFENIPVTSGYADNGSGLGLYYKSCEIFFEYCNGCSIFQSRAPTIIWTATTLRLLSSSGDLGWWRRVSSFGISQKIEGKYHWSS